MSFVESFNEDGRDFIKTATDSLIDNALYADISPKISRKEKLQSSHRIPPLRMRCPKVFSHYVLNLPATALTFLPAFIGVYAGRQDLFEPHRRQKLPMVHVHCFNIKADDNTEAEKKICQEVSHQLGYTMKMGDPERGGEMEIWDVRDVAPQKRMFCATFRLPEEVAFCETTHQ